MEIIKLENNPVNGGVCANFKHDGTEYYADLCDIGYSIGTECMIFEVKNGQVDWGDLYCKRGIEVNKNNLKKCIEEFCKELGSEE